jgi:hypothetical protein
MLAVGLNGPSEPVLPLEKVACAKLLKTKIVTTARHSDFLIMIFLLGFDHCI